MKRDQSSNEFTWTQVDDSDATFIAAAKEYMTNKQLGRCLLKAELFVDPSEPLPRAGTIKVTHCMY